MPNTYTLLETISVGAAGAASVTFNSIPQTGYTDLVVKMSSRTTAVSGNFPNPNIIFNGSSSAVYSWRGLYGSGSAAGSNNNSSTTSSLLGVTTDSLNSSTFGNMEIYIPNYTSSNYKSISTDSVSEANQTTAWMYLTAGISASTAAISSMTISPGSGSFAQHSTFSLYGVSALGTTPTKAPRQLAVQSFRPMALIGITHFLAPAPLHLSQPYLAMS
jgi:hypothetical protein